MNDRPLDSVYWPLRLTYGLVPLIAGADKFLGLLTDWERYLSSPVAALLPVSPAVALAVAGVVEMAVGIAILSRWTRLGALVAAIWLVLLSVNLLLAGYPDVAVRDLAMAVGAYALAGVAAARARALTPATRPVAAPSAA